MALLDGVWCSLAAPVYLSLVEHGKGAVVHADYVRRWIGERR